MRSRFATAEIISHSYLFDYGLLDTPICGSSHPWRCFLHGKIRNRSAVSHWRVYASCLLLHGCAEEEECVCVNGMMNRHRRVGVPPVHHIPLSSTQHSQQCGVVECIFFRYPRYCGSWLLQWERADCFGFECDERADRIWNGYELLQERCRMQGDWAGETGKSGNWIVLLQLFARGRRNMFFLCERLWCVEGTKDRRFLFHRLFRVWNR